MSYATQADIVPLRMTQEDLAELTSETDEADATVVSAALDEASSIVDSYCGQRYRTPLQASGLVKTITVDLAIYALGTRRREISPKETWAIKRDQAIALLKDVASGKASLDQPATALPQSSSADVTITSERQTFDDCNLRGFC